jgi:hypothetical protein
MKNAGWVPADVSGSAVGRTPRIGRTAVTAATRRFERRLAHRDRAVYVAELFCGKHIDDPGPGGQTSRRARFAELPGHEPFSPLAATLLRPVGDAAAAIQALLRR